MSLASEGDTCLEGDELTKKINYLGPWLLTHLLNGLLEHDARIIVVSPSDSHRNAILKAKSKGKGLFREHTAATSDNLDNKSRLILFAMELNLRLQNKGVGVYVTQPDTTDSGIWNNIPFPLTIVEKVTANLVEKVKSKVNVKSTIPVNTAAIGAKTTIFLASVAKEQLVGESGEYFEKCQVKVYLGKHGIDHESASQLWKKTNENVKRRPGEGEDLTPLWGETEKIDYDKIDV